MSRPVDNQSTLGPVDDRLIDRLVDGEAPDMERRDLLLRLDAEPGGWRRCALAFMEAQSWREALFPLAGGLAARPLPLPGRHARQRVSRRRIAALIGLAASVVVAFALGWLLHLPPTPPTQDVSVADGPESVPANTAERREPAPADVATPRTQPRKPGETLAFVDPLVKQWEQRGFHAHTQERLVPMQLKDGRKLNVPVQEIRLRPVRNRTY